MQKQLRILRHAHPHPRPLPLDGRGRIVLSRSAFPTAIESARDRSGCSLSRRTGHLFSVVGTSRCDVRAACSGATLSIASVAPIFVPPATTRAGTAQRAIPTIALTISTNPICDKCAGFFSQLWASSLVGLRSKTSLYTYRTGEGQGEGRFARNAAPVRELFLHKHLTQ